MKQQTMKLNIEKIRADFPALDTTVYNKPLVYLDNAATTHKPKSVLDALTDSYTHRNANIHRGVHRLSQDATEAHEAARTHIASFLSAPSKDEVLFTRGTTEGINLVASCYCEKFCKPGDEILVSRMEHHSNIVPWQMAAEKTGAVVKAVNVTPEGLLDLEHLASLLGERTKVVSFCHASNVLGTINPISRIAEMVHATGAILVVDGAQAVAHTAVNVQDLGADFYAFSGHKIYAPTGIGVLWGRSQLLESMPPYQGGGEMIRTVSLDHGTTYNDLPFKYEAGTPDFISSVALSEAVRYVEEIGFAEIAAYEKELLNYATAQLTSEISDVRLIGTAPQKEAVLSFLIGDLHPFDVGTLLDRQGIAIRTGHHCAQPLMHHLGIEGTMRASFSFYNTKEEINVFVHALKRAVDMLR